MSDERCSGCGALLAMVGRAHRCVANAVPEKSSEPATPVAAVSYRYRDPEKRRAYMRDLMKKRRAKK